jgi:hypothetical protein
MLSEPRTDTRVRGVHDEDFESIVTVNKMSRPGVAALDRQAIQHLWSLGADILVAELQGSVAGYLIALSSDAGYEAEEFLWYRRKLEEPFFYIDQIATNARFRQRGVATALYQAFMDFGREQGISTYCCEVNLKPPNPISLAFHRRLGFCMIDTLDIAADRRVALLMSSS